VTSVAANKKNSVVLVDHPADATVAALDWPATLAEKASRSLV
jgi:hypothetical protein